MLDTTLAKIEKVVVVQAVFTKDGLETVGDKLNECLMLVESAGGIVAKDYIVKRQVAEAATFIGKGKLEEIASFVLLQQCNLVVFNHALSPIQQRNLEKILSCRVIDRASLILDIFALRAKSAEGKLQVELAQLQHLATRLVRGWTHLERQQGGIGVRGPGETQLETDRRLLGKRVKILKERLAKLDRQRQTQRQGRNSSRCLNISLVGYTNAGKSTLFNALTHGQVYAADQLFATLDTTTRKFWLDGIGECVLSDTVGFISDLPHELIAAFHATLQATAESDLLIHVIDGASPAREQQIKDVNLVLKQISADQIPQILLINKIDCLDLPPKWQKEENANLIGKVWLSAKNSQGLNFIRQALVDFADKYLQKSTLI